MVYLLYYMMIIYYQESNSLPLPQLEGDDRAQARALATIYSHPVVSSESLASFLLII